MKVETLAAIQAELARLYDLPLSERVEDFVCDVEVARAAVGAAVERREVLVVVEEVDDVLVGLYVDPLALERLSAAGEPPDLSCPERFGAYCVAAEGVSHFVYLMYRLAHEQPVSQLELEVQAEVDKYATALLAGNGMGAIRERSRALRERLYENVRFVDADGTVEGERYRRATRAAAKFTAQLERRFVERGAIRELQTALRRFYRQGGAAKLAAAEAESG